MKMNQLIPAATLERLPLSFQYFKAIDKSKSVFIDKYVRIRKYQSERCAVHAPLKPVSKIL